MSKDDNCLDQSDRLGRNLLDVNFQKHQYYFKGKRFNFTNLYFNHDQKHNCIRLVDVDIIVFDKVCMKALDIIAFIHQNHIERKDDEKEQQNEEKDGNQQHAGKRREVVNHEQDQIQEESYQKEEQCSPKSIREQEASQQQSPQRPHTAENDSSKVIRWN